MEAKHTINDFLEITDSNSGSFSPDGKQIAYLSNASGTYQLYLTYCDDPAKVRQITKYDESLSFAVFSPIRQEILFGMAMGGNEKTQFYLYDVTTDAINQLTVEISAIHRWGSWSSDGKFITYASNARNGTDFDIYIMDLVDKTSHIVFDQGGWCDALCFSPNNSHLVVRKQHTFLNHDLYLVDIKTLVCRLLTHHADSAEYLMVQWLPDASGFFYITNESSDLAGISYYQLNSNENRNIIIPRWDIENIAVSPDGKLMAIVTNENGYGDLKVLATSNLDIIGKNIFTDGLTTDIKWSSDGKTLLFTAQKATQPSNIWIWDSETNRKNQLTQSLSRISPELFIEETLVSYSSFDDLEIPVFLFTPKIYKQKLPTIVVIHGGPEGQYRPRFDPLIQYFIYQGYAVVAPNVRGSSGYGKKYLALDDIEKRIDSVNDLASLHQYLATQENIDTNKIALLGASYGGYMVLAGLAFQPSLWSAGVDIVGISNLVTFLQNTSPWRRALREAEYGSLSTDIELLRAISPIHSTDNISAPLYIIHGANDPRVPVSEAEQMQKQLKDSGKEVQMLVYEDEGHGLAKLKNKLDAYPKIVNFLNQHLG